VTRGGKRVKWGKGEESRRSRVTEGGGLGVKFSPVNCRQLLATSGTVGSLLLQYTHSSCPATPPFVLPTQSRTNAQLIEFRSVNETRILLDHAVLPALVCCVSWHLLQILLLLLLFLLLLLLLLLPLAN